MCIHCLERRYWISSWRSKSPISSSRISDDGDFLQIRNQASSTHSQVPEDTNKDSNKLPWCTRNQRDTKPETLNTHHRDFLYISNELCPQRISCKLGIKNHRPILESLKTQTPIPIRSIVQKKPKRH